MKIYIRKNICFLRILVAIFLSFNFACESKQTSSQVSDESKRAAIEYSSAVNKVEANDPSGLLKLYEIATNDVIYTVEYSEIAQESIQEYLFNKPELWVKTFSEIDQEEFRKFFNSVGFSDYPEGVLSDEQYIKLLLNKLSNIKWKNKEAELVNYINDICEKQSVAKDR
jgi:hypothetical protein